MVYPEDLQIGNDQKDSVTALIHGCLRRLPNVPLPLAETNIHAHENWYLPFLYHILERIKLNISVQVLKTKQAKHMFREVSNNWW